MDPMSFDMQVGMLMGGFHVVQAFDLFRQTLLPGTDDLAAKAAKMRSDAAFCLMADLDFRQAIQHFRRSPIAVQEMLMLVPKLLPKSFSYEPQEEYNPLVKFRCDLEGMVQMALTRHTGNEVTEMSSEELARRAEMVSEELAKAKTMLAEILEFKRDAAAGVCVRARALVHTHCGRSPPASNCAAWFPHSACPHLRRPAHCVLLSVWLPLRLFDCPLGWGTTALNCSKLCMTCEQFEPRSFCHRALVQLSRSYLLSSDVLRAPRRCGWGQKKTRQSLTMSGWCLPAKHRCNRSL
eukprot:COSAG01_NODE_98_length_26629_cov_56.866453_24_plen_294_part_00